MVRSRRTVLSVFTGAGGLDLGLECAGFRTIGSIELDKAARSTVQANRPRWNLLEAGDVVEAAKALTPRQLGLRKRELGMLVGGPPCQPFSKAAQWAAGGRRGLSDPRTKCLAAFFLLLENFLPECLFIENVSGFVHGRTSALAYLEQALQAINRRNGTRYRLQWRVLNAASFGVPQNRARAIIVARRDGSDFEWPEPTHRKPVRAADALSAVRPAKLPKSSGYWAGLLPSIPEGRNYLFHTAGDKGRPLFGRRTRFWSFLLKLSRSEPAWTLPAKPGPSTGPFHWQNRPLAVEELLRLQSFPADWFVSGGHTAQVRQIGNATPPLLTEIIGRALGSQVFGVRYRTRPRLTISRRRTLPPKVRTRPVPEKYLKHLNSQRPHPGEGKGPGALARKATLRPLRRVTPRPLRRAA